MDKVANFIDKAALLAERRSRLYKRLGERLNPKQREKLIELISEMPNETFISDKERKSKNLYPNTTLEELKIDKSKILKSI